VFSTFSVPTYLTRLHKSFQFLNLNKTVPPTRDLAAGVKPYFFGFTSGVNIKNIKKIRIN
jgi:hypothetical protein